MLPIAVAPQVKSTSSVLAPQSRTINVGGTYWQHAVPTARVHVPNWRNSSRSGGRQPDLRRHLRCTRPCLRAPSLCRHFITRQQSIGGPASGAIRWGSDNSGALQFWRFANLSLVGVVSGQLACRGADPGVETLFELSRGSHASAVLREEVRSKDRGPIAHERPRGSPTLALLGKAGSPLGLERGAGKGHLRVFQGARGRGRSPWGFPWG